MEDEYGSSARLLPSPEEKPASKPAAENASEPKEKKVLLLTAGEEKLAESKPVTAIPVSESKEDTGAFQMQLLFAAEEKPVESTLAVGSELGESKPAFESEPAESKEQHKVSETQILAPAGEKLAESKPAPENEPAASKEQENKISEVMLEPAVKERQAESAPAIEIKPAPSKAAEKKAFERPFRVKLRGSVLVLVRLPNKRSVRAAIHQLSTSGGVIHFEKPLDEKLEVELIFHLKKATIRGKAQMLFPMWATQGWMQPFRFVNLGEANREMLDAKLKSFLGEAKGAAAGA
jgi:hypothetical protein